MNSYAGTLRALGVPMLEDRQARATGSGLRLALNGIERGGVEIWIRASGADRLIHQRLDAITGGEFSDKELQELEGRALDKATKADISNLMGLQDGHPIVLSPTQRAAIEGLLSRLGDDALARRARGAYGRAIQSGAIRFR